MQLLAYWIPSQHPERTLEKSKFQYIVIPLKCDYSFPIGYYTPFVSVAHTLLHCGKMVMVIGKLL